MELDPERPLLELALEPERLLLLLLELALLSFLPPELVPLLLLEDELELVELGRSLLELELVELGRLLPELELLLLGRLTLPESLLLGRLPPELLLLAGRSVLLEPLLLGSLLGRVLLPLLPELLLLGRVVAPPPLPLLGVGLVGVRELMLPAVLEPLGRTTVASDGLL